MRSRAYVLLEGDRDGNYFYSIFSDLLKQKFRIVNTWKVSKSPKEDTEKFIRSAKNYVCLFVHDFDEDICITKKKNELKSIYNGLTDEDIHIVKQEIESWYLAGINPSLCTKLGITENIENPDNLSKSDFIRIKPKRMTESVFCQTILDNYDLKLGMKRSPSLNRFFKKAIEDSS